MGEFVGFGVLISPGMNRELDAMCRRENCTKSTAVRAALRLLLDRVRSEDMYSIELKKQTR